MLSLWCLLDTQVTISDHIVVDAVLCFPFPGQDQGTNSLSYQDWGLLKVYSWILLWTLPLAQRNCLVQGYTLFLKVAHIQWLVDAGVQQPGPLGLNLELLWRAIPHQSSSLVGYCCDFVVAHLLLLPKPASFTSHRYGSQDHTPMKFVHVNLCLRVCVLGNMT